MTINKKDLVVIAVTVAALIAFASLAAYANANMQFSSSSRYQPQNQGYGSGMMGGGGMMGGYYSNQGYQQQAAPNNNNNNPPQQQYYGQGMMGPGGMMGGGGMMSGGGYRAQTGQGTANQSLAHCGGAVAVGGMMNGIGGMMGGSGGMMGGGYYQTVPTALTHAQAEQVANNLLTSLKNSSLSIGDFDEYSNNFYLSIVDNRTGTGVLEVLIDRFTGSVYPEPQSMMWNTAYGGMGRMMNSMMGGAGGGMMGGGRYYYQSNGTVTITSDQAKNIAQEFLNVTYPKTVAGDVETFPGYYTIETTLNGETYGMLSINSYTGAIWYHTWHGMFITALK